VGTVLFKLVLPVFILPYVRKYIKVQNVYVTVTGTGSNTLHEGIDKIIGKSQCLISNHRLPAGILLYWVKNPIVNHILKNVSRLFDQCFFFLIVAGCRYILCCAGIWHR
jgi:hypothetical protein